MRVPGFRFVQAAGDYADKDGMHYGIAVHATSNTAGDEAESSYAAHRADGTSAHAYVDWDSLTQALDTDRKAGHAGSSNGNENAIAIEFTGLDSYSRDRWLASIAWEQVGAWIAYVLAHDPDYRGFQVRRASVAEMQSNPRVKAFYGHDDMRRAWGGTTHTDPGPNFPWDRLFSAVTAAQGGDNVADSDLMRGAAWRTEALIKMLPVVGGTKPESPTAGEPNLLAAAIAAIPTDTGTVALTPEDREAIITGVVDGVLAVLSTKIGEVLVEAIEEIGYKPFRIAPPPPA